jgi:cell division protein FtsI (penicillin-binding protein 3)
VAAAIVCVIAVVGVFVVRLVDIQVVRASQLVDDSLAKTSSEGTIYAPRGSIVDTNGTVLAGSVTLFDVTISPKDVGEFTRTAEDGTTSTIGVDQAMAEIGAVTGQSTEELVAIVDDALAADASSNFAYLIKGVKYDTYQALLALKKQGIWWIYPKQTSGRTYPNGAVAGGVVGYVGSDNVGLGGLELSVPEEQRRGRASRDNNGDQGGRAGR